MTGSIRGMPAGNRHKISVCIPTYNHGRFLPDAVGSVLAQTFRDFELIIVDNASTDDTPELGRKFAESDPRIGYIANRSNVGMLNNFNLCLKHASGEYIKILCADDLLEPTCLEKLLHGFESRPNASLVGAARLLVDENLEPLKVLSYADRFVTDAGTNVIERCLLEGNLIGEPSSVMFRKADAERGFSTGYTQLFDLEMWFHLLEKGDFVFFPEPLSRFRRHGGQLTWEYLKDPGFFDDAWKIFNDYVDKDYIRISRPRKALLKVTRRGGMEILRRSRFARLAFSTFRSRLTARRHHV
jgi:glycosyltransferase involved in cell wall biosynthesis